MVGPAGHELFKHLLGDGKSVAEAKIVSRMIQRRVRALLEPAQTRQFGAQDCSQQGPKTYSSSEEPPPKQGGEEEIDQHAC